MSASIRFELFTSDLEKHTHFYVETLLFSIRKQTPGYTYLNRDNIFLALLEAPNDDPFDVKKNYRQPPKGIELVIEVGDIVAERDRIVAQGWQLDADIRLQEWGLEDFRLTDPDGYYLRFTTHGLKGDGTGH